MLMVVPDVLQMAGGGWFWSKEDFDPIFFRERDREKKMIRLAVMETIFFLPQMHYATSLALWYNIMK